MNEENFIRFKYAPTESFMANSRKTIIEYDEDYFYGIMEKIDLNNLRHCSLYLMCEEVNISGNVFYKLPIAVVAKNESEATIKYSNFNDAENIVSMCALENRCDNLKVETV